MAARSSNDTKFLGSLMDYRNFRVHVKNDFGAKGDGITDDTIAINKAIAAVDTSKGQILIFEPGTYLVPNGIVNTQVGLIVEGLGHISAGPGNDQFNMSGVFIKTTGTGKWCWTTKGAVDNANEFRGGRMSNMGFLGTSATAGGLLIKTCQNIIDNCFSVGHTTGIGMMTNYPPTSPADSTTLNRLFNCVDANSLIGFQLGSDWVGASYTHLNNCIASKFQAGGIYHTGQGVVIWDSGSSIMGGHFESHDVGILCNQQFSARIIGPMFEDNNTWDINLARASGSNGTRNLIVCTTSKINIGSHQNGDVIIGGDFNNITDAGDTTLQVSHERISRGATTL